MFRYYLGMLKKILFGLLLISVGCKSAGLRMNSTRKYTNVNCQLTNDSIVINDRVFKRMIYETSHGPLLPGSFWNLSNDSLFMFSNESTDCSDEKHPILFAELMDLEYFGCHYIEFKEKLCQDIIGFSEWEEELNAYKIEHYVLQSGCFEGADIEEMIIFSECYVIDKSGKIIFYKRNKSQGEMYKTIRVWHSHKEIEPYQQFFDRMKLLIPQDQLALYKSMELDSTGACFSIVHPYFKQEFGQLDSANSIHKDLEASNFFTDSLKILALEIRFHFYENEQYFDNTDISRAFMKLHDYRNVRP